MQPDYKSALAERGELYTFQGNYDLAEKDLKNLLKLQPDSKLGNEYTEIIKTARKNGFNTGKTKEDTLLKFDEDSDAVISGADVYTNTKHGRMKDYSKKMFNGNFRRAFCRSERH